jgi:hypothetical protein
MQIEKIVSIIRKSNIGNLIYKIKTNDNFLGVYGLKQRPLDVAFLESGTLNDIDSFGLARKQINLFRTFIPKDFVVLATPKSWIKSNSDSFYPINEYHLIDLDLYAYLLVAEGVRSGSIGIGSSEYSELFLLDGRQIDYTNSITSNIFQYSLTLAPNSNLISYIYKKNNSALFNEQCIDDFLIASKGVSFEDLKTSFNDLNIFSSIDKQI